METIRVDLGKLSDAVKNKVVKKDVHDKFVKEANATQITDTSNLIKESWLWHKNW